MAASSISIQQRPFALPQHTPPWRAILYDGHSVALAEQARTMLKVAIEPACGAVASELASLNRGPDDMAISRWDALRETELELHRSFALGLGGMWERHFRRHLYHSATVIGPKSKTFLKSIERDGWDALESAFEKVRGFPLSKFSSYPDLALLYEVTSAVRHGNGPATERLYISHAELFSHTPIRSWHSYLPLGGEPPHSIHALEITTDRLRTFAAAVADFWDAIRKLQRTSKT